MPVLTVHVAGPDVQVSSHLRQRCSWCGYVLVDEDLARVAVAVVPGEEPRGFLTWAVGAFIAVEDGNPRVSYVVEPEVHEDGSKRLPDGSCMLLPPEVTAWEDAPPEDGAPLTLPWRDPSDPSGDHGVLP